MPKELDGEQLVDMKYWLEEMQVHAKRLPREFSDGVLMANLLKRIHPRLVDLNNYPSRFSTQLKLINWDLLNQKVLLRLGLQQSRAVLEKLANANPGSIELLLHTVMEHYNRLKQQRSRSRGRSPSQCSFRFDGSNPDFLMVNVQKEIDGEMVTLPQKMIAFTLYEEARREIKEKSSYIDALKKEISRLNSLLDSAKAAIIG